MRTGTPRQPAARLPRPAQMGDVPLEIDGMEVMVDRRVTLFPVTLVEVPAAAGENGQDARAASR